MTNDERHDMNDLVQFLLDRLAIEEHVAKAASPGPWHINPDDDEVLAVDDIVVAEGFALSGRQLRATIEHIARHDPARALREVDAKRRIIGDYDDAVRSLAAAGQSGTVYDLMTGATNTLKRTLRLLALPYTDHPDYRDDWKP